MNRKIKCGYYMVQSLSEHNDPSLDFWSDIKSCEIMHGDDYMYDLSRAMDAMNKYIEKFPSRASKTRIVFRNDTPLKSA